MRWRAAGHRGNRRANTSEAPIVVPVAGTALLLIDVINDLAFDDSDAIVTQAESMAGSLRAPEAARDGRRRADDLHQRQLRPVAVGFPPHRRTLHRTLLPGPSHLVASATNGTRLLRAQTKHSGFFDTTLDTLLETLRIRRVILAGIAGNICVLFTANDAYMREYKIFAPADCIVSNTAADNDHALRQIRTVLKGNVSASTRLRFRSHGRGRPARRR